MKTTIEIDDELFRRTKAEAAMRGQSLKDFFTAALLDYLNASSAAGAGRPAGWRSVFGLATVDMVEPVDAAVAEAFGRVDPDDWR